MIVYHGPGEFSTLWALDKRTGEKRWSVPLKEEHPPERFDGFAGQSDGMIGTFSTPLVVPAAGRQEVILPVVNRLRAFDRDTGRPLWTADGMNPLVYASPIYADGTVAILGGSLGVRSLSSPVAKGMSPTGGFITSAVSRNTALEPRGPGRPPVLQSHRWVRAVHGAGHR